MMERRLIRRCINCGHVEHDAKEKVCVACGSLLRESPNVVIKGAGADPASTSTGRG
jgi:rRNA maturation endonuclease Nob1